MSKVASLLVATHNEGKRGEFEKLLAPHVGTIFSAAQKKLPEPEETEKTFAGNAKLKAVAGAKATGLLTLADDSGFGLAALNGKPGVLSARFAQTKKGYDYDDAAQRLIEKMELGAPREAFFICVLALARPNGVTYMAEGRVDGRFVYPGRGVHGFGYDPFFVPEGHARTFGEMTPDEKQAISHRGKALAKLVQFFASADGQMFTAVLPVK